MFGGIIITCFNMYDVLLRTTTILNYYYMHLYKKLARNKKNKKTAKKLEKRFLFFCICLSYFFYSLLNASMVRIGKRSGHNSV